MLHGYAGTIRAADPTARLAGPNVLNWDFVCVGCPGYPQGLAWTEAMRAAYADRYGDQPPLDIWTIHLYELDWVHFPNGNAAMNIDQLQGMRRWLDAFDDLRDRPMWLTEVGIHWGFPGLAWENGVAVPVGEFAYDHVETYLRELFGWLNDHAESMHIDRWFLWTASAQHGEGFESQYAGITLMDGLDADAPIGRLGRVYQELAGVR